MSDLSLLLQTATLYASGESSTFIGTGGPFGFSPFTSQFGGVVTTRGLGTEPFNDTVYSVAPGDEVIFVIAAQNFSSGQRAFGLGLAATMPAGFAVPVDGTNLTVTDGTGTDLAFTGDLFGAGIRLAAPVAPLDLDSGLNVVLVTYTLVAGPSLPGPYAAVPSTAIVTHAATTPGGADAGVRVSATTTVVTAAPSPVVTAETSPAAVAKGQPIAFDVSVAIPAGTMRDVRLDTLLPGGASRLSLVSTTVTGMGSALRLGTPVVGADGGVQFGTVTSTGDPAGNTITLRVVVRAQGSISGTALLQTVLSSASTEPDADRWSATVSSSVGVVVPPSPPSVSGAAVQIATASTVLHPFGNLVLSDNDADGTATLAVAVGDRSLGRLGGGGSGGYFDAAGATFFMTGSLAALQAAVRQLVFTPSAPGLARFTVTLVDPGGGVAQDDGTAVAIGGTASDPVTVASGGRLWVTELRGAINLLGQNATVRADRVAGTPTVTGFGEGDRLILPGTASGTTLSFAPGTRGGTLTVGSMTVTFAGTYDASWFQLSAGSEGTLVIGFRSDPLFDAVYYLAHNPDVAAAGVDPFQHYLGNGWREGRAAAAFFDTSYYLRTNPDVKAAGINPLLHYENSGWREGRNPSAGFSERDYLAANADVQAAGTNPLLHYMVTGQSEGRAAFGVSALPLNPLIDLAAYYAGNPDVRAAGADATSHYLISGWQEGRNPNAFFDSSFYLAQNPDVRAAGLNPLLHFEMDGWREGRQPSLVFDGAKYFAANSDVQGAGINPLVHFLLWGRSEGRTASLVGGTAAADPLADPAFYDAQLGATIIPTGIAAFQQAAYSYDQGGWQRGLNPDPWFDTQYYLSHNPDIAAAHINPLLHYETNGWREGRAPSAAFDARKYLAANPDVLAAGVEPLQHYVVNGAREGRAAWAV